MHPAQALSIVLYFTTLFGHPVRTVSCSGSASHQPAARTPVVRLRRSCCGARAGRRRAPLLRVPPSIWPAPSGAWRAFWPWRSSWLSREGVPSVAHIRVTGSGVRDRLDLFRGRLSREHYRPVRGFWLPRTCKIGTIYCTGMIYASLRPIHQWHNRWVVPNYLAAGINGGAFFAGSCPSAFGSRFRSALRPGHLSQC